MKLVGGILTEYIFRSNWMQITDLNSGQSRIEEVGELSSP